MPASKLPATKTYRVAQAGVIYNRFVESTGLDGEDTIVVVRELATFGQRVELTEREVNRINKIGAELTPPVVYVKPEDAPLSYDEMNDKQLDAEIKERGVTVTSSGADQDQPLRTDKINALLTFDQGQGSAGQPAVPAA
jgi:hypothetical protein